MILIYQQGNYYIFDRGYNDFSRLYAINNHNAFFVFRARNGVKFRHIYSIKNENQSGIKADQIGVFTTGNSPKRYPKKICKICYYDTEQDRDFVSLTNDFNSDANTITELYRNYLRNIAGYWQVITQQNAHKSTINKI